MFTNTKNLNLTSWINFTDEGICCAICGMENSTPSGKESICQTLHITCKVKQDRWQHISPRSILVKKEQRWNAINSCKHRLSTKKIPAVICQRKEHTRLFIFNIPKDIFKKGMKSKPLDKTFLAISKHGRPNRCFSWKEKQEARTSVSNYTTFFFCCKVLHRIPVTRQLCLYHSNCIKPADKKYYSILQGLTMARNFATFPVWRWCLSKVYSQFCDCPYVGPNCDRIGGSVNPCIIIVFDHIFRAVNTYKGNGMRV